MKLTLSRPLGAAALLDPLQAEVGTLKRLQAETTVDLDASLPAVLNHAFKGES